MRHHQHFASGLIEVVHPLALLFNDDAVLDNHLHAKTRVACAAQALEFAAARPNWSAVEKPGTAVMPFTCRTDIDDDAPAIA